MSSRFENDQKRPSGLSLGFIVAICVLVILSCSLFLIMSIIIYRRCMRLRRGTLGTSENENFGNKGTVALNSDFSQSSFLSSTTQFHQLLTPAPGNIRFFEMRSQASSLFDMNKPNEETEQSPKGNQQELDQSIRSAVELQRRESDTQSSILSAVMKAFFANRSNNPSVDGSASGSIKRTTGVPRLVKSMSKMKQKSSWEPFITNDKSTKDDGDGDDDDDDDDDKPLATLGHRKASCKSVPENQLLRTPTSRGPGINYASPPTSMMASPSRKLSAATLA